MGEPKLLPCPDCGALPVFHNPQRIGRRFRVIDVECECTTSDLCGDAVDSPAVIWNKWVENRTDKETKNNE